MTTFYTTTLEGMTQNVTAVSGHIDSLTTSANETFAAISELLEALSSYSITMDAYVPGAAAVTQSELPVAYTADAAFTYADEAFSGEAPDLSDLSVNIGPVPELSHGRPVFDIPDPPNVTWPTFTEDPPSPTTLNLPNAPDVVLPSPPTLEEIDVPAPPSAAVPEFEGTEPNIDLTPPNVAFSWTEDQYATALLTALRSRLESDMATGGQGLAANIEQAMYDREESRVMDEEEDAYLAVLGSGVDRGFALPPGDVVGDMLKLGDKINQNREELNSRIVNEQTTLAIKNAHFYITASIKFETMMLEHHNNVQQRNFEAAKFALTAAMDIYNARVEAFKAKAMVYAVLAKVYDAKIRAEIVKAELYKAHIEGLKVGVEMNALRVQRYKAQLNGIRALVELYKAEMQAGHVAAEVERTRIQGYLAKVEAYQARISSIQAQADAYVAQVRGEEVKADMIKADANAYKAEMRAYEAQAQVEVEEAQAAVEALRAKILVYNAQVDKYSATIERDIGVGKASQRLRDAQARLRVIQARYEEATTALDAKLHQAESISSAARNRARAIAHESEMSAAVAANEGAHIAMAASADSMTAIAVATFATDTTNISDNTRTVEGQDKGDIVMKGRLGNRADSLTVAYSHYYDHSS